MELDKLYQSKGEVITQIELLQIELKKINNEIVKKGQQDGWIKQEKKRKAPKNICNNRYKSDKK